MSTTVSLYYAHDPMCSWCYAFRPALTQILDKLPAEIEVIRLLGGLASDSSEAMPDNIRHYIVDNWQRIEQQVPGTSFNYDFWSRCQPRRSTYPACRAVIAARLQGSQFDIRMTHAIQNAYYRQARNPSDNTTLIELASELGLDTVQFSQDIISTETDDTLRREIKQSRLLGMKSFPSLLLEYHGQTQCLQIDYLNSQTMLNSIAHIMTQQ